MLPTVSMHQGVQHTSISQEKVESQHFSKKKKKSADNTGFTK